MKQIVLWPSGEGTWFTPSRSTVRVRPGLLNRNGANPLGAGHACKTCSFEFESQWRLSKNGVVRQRLSGLF